MSISGYILKPKNLNITLHSYLIRMIISDLTQIFLNDFKSYSLIHSPVFHIFAGRH